MTHKLNRSIEFRQYTSAKNGAGHSVETLAKNLSAYAEVRKLTGARAYLDGQIGLDNLFEFVVRFNPAYDFTGDWRVIYDRRKFIISSVEKENQEEFYLIIKAAAAGPR